MITDLVITGGTIVTPEGARRAAVAVAGGIIAAVDRDDTMPQARETIDAQGVHMFPGFIDTHVHLRDRGEID
jgi:dihydroorotase